MPIDRDNIRERLLRGERPHTIHGRDRKTAHAVLQEQARLDGELGTVEPTPENVVRLREERQLRWEAVAVRLYGAVRNVAGVKALYDQAKGPGAHRRSYIGRGRRFPEMTSQPEASKNPGILSVSEAGSFAVREKDAPTERLADLEILRTGTNQDIRTYLEYYIHSDRFYMDGDRIWLELPNRNDAPADRVLETWFTVPRSYAVVSPTTGSRVGRHVRPQGWDTTLCRIPISSWKSGIRTHENAKVTCRWCQVRLIALEIADADELGIQGHEAEPQDTEIIEFHNDEEGYDRWLQDLTHEYVLQVRRPRPPALPHGSYTLHHKTCPTLNRPGPKTNNPKLCGTRQALTDWTRKRIDEPPTLCSFCWT